MLELEPFQKFKTFISQVVREYVCGMPFLGVVLLTAVVATEVACLVCGFLVTLLLLGTYSILPGIACLAIGGFCLYRALIRLRRRQLALGTITDIRYGNPKRHGITFLTKAKQRVTAETTWGAEMGAKLLLLYDPEKPEAKVKKFAFASIWCSTIIWSWVGWVYVYSGINYKSLLTASSADFVSAVVFLFLMWIAPLFLVLIIGTILFHFYRNYRVQVTEIISSV